MVATNPRITIKNFQSISANTPVRFQVLYVIPPAGTNTHTMKISLISLKNRIYANLNEDVFTFTINSLTTSGIATSNIVYTSDVVNTYFDVTFTPNFGAIAANSYILVMLPSYDTKFIQLDSIISCNIQTVSGNPFVSLPCISYYGVDWIMIQSSSALPATTSIKITNLLCPRYVISHNVSIYENSKRMYVCYKSKSPRFSAFHDSSTKKRLRICRLFLYIYFPDTKQTTKQFTNYLDIPFNIFLNRQ